MDATFWALWALGILPNYMCLYVQGVKDGWVILLISVFAWPFIGLAMILGGLYTLLFGLPKEKD